MKPEVILQSDMLDILFENRNKDYGAYALRKNYNKRLLQSLGATCLIVGIFIGLQSMKSKNDGQISGFLPPDTHLVDYVIPKNDRSKKPAQKIHQSEKIKTVPNTVPVIKPDNEVKKTTVNAVEVLDSSNIGSKPGEGRQILSGDPFDKPTEGGGEKPVEEPTEPVINTPLNFAEVMPSFNGDLKKFMLRNLKQPDDLADGERIMVRVKFIVNANGEITDAEVIQSGRPDLDQEVLRVVKKMPKWKPGIQSGKYVPVFFNLPVTFVSNTE